MYLATEYFARSGIAKSMLGMPCSLFVTHFSSEEKKVITVAHAYRMAGQFVVKHWLVDRCTSEESLPPIQEYLVDSMDDASIILPEHRLLKYSENPVLSGLNGQTHPMPNDMFVSYADNYLLTHSHRTCRTNWLWRSFVQSHFPYLRRLCDSLFVYRNYEDSAEDERETVRRYYPDRWLYWLRWRKFMLDLAPAELAYAVDYHCYEDD